uniref:Uncharacterized protein n=1 Tax=Ananas comosus var. bracteatus TaxID=296719 RepID=A0A6V7Q9J5_ANACO|nr:unnamed protein product [Ananas comosus var. bracteatus]
MSTAKLLPLLLLLLAVAVAAAATATPIQAVVEGIVYCQSCSCRGSWSLRDSKPLPPRRSASPAATPRTGPTSTRYFYCPMTPVNATDYYKGDPVEACYVRLLSSADGKCNHLTNINYGLTGAKLKKEDKTKRAGLRHGDLRGQVAGIPAGQLHAHAPLPMNSNSLLMI